MRKVNKKNSSRREKIEIYVSFKFVKIAVGRKAKSQKRIPHVRNAKLLG